MQYITDMSDLHINEVLEIWFSNRQPFWVFAHYLFIYLLIRGKERGKDEERTLRKEEIKLISKRWSGAPPRMDPAGRKPWGQSVGVPGVCLCSTI